jgi:DNA-directed RNA polymerase subunit E'
MYNLVTIKDTIRIPPRLFSQSLEESVLKAIREQYEGKIDRDVGVVITAVNPREVGDGKVILGDGAAYHEVVFDVVAFKPELHEMVKGKITDLTEFGAFLRFGPIDGLIHVSQVTDDFMSYNDKMGMLAGKSSKKTLKKGDVVTARVIAISMKDSVTDSKINLTMRQTGLGKPEWYEKEEKVKTARPKRTARKKK